MVQQGHAFDLQVGWYLNNCYCREDNVPPDEVQKRYRGDVKAAFHYEFAQLLL